MNEVKVRSDSYEEINSDGLTRGISANAEQYEPAKNVDRGQSKIDRGFPAQITLDGRRLDHAQLPGHGLPGKGCGTYVPKFCNDCGHSFWGRKDCHERQCPSCYEKWARNQAEDASVRIWYGMEVKYGKTWQKRGVRLVHAVTTHIEDGETDIPEYREISRRQLRRRGFDGGLSICHPWRQDESGRFVRDGTIHFHDVVAIDGSWTSNEAGVKTDEFFKVIRDAGHSDYQGFRSREELQACIFYLLTHCAVVERCPSITYWGVLSYNQLSCGTLDGYMSRQQIDAKRRNGQPCPKCGSDNVESCYDWEPGMGHIAIHPMPNYPPGPPPRPPDLYEGNT